MLRCGQVLGARYEILAPVGHGGMAAVFEATDRVTGGVVAVKVLRAEWAARPDMRERFHSEIVLAQKVRHRNVCRVLDCGEDGPRRYIVTDLIHGVDLKRLLQAAGALPADHAFDGAIQVARGLQAVHDAGIVHRDIKSPNIVVDRTGRFRLLDFDLAERLEDAHDRPDGAILGTPEYMSPEQARGEAMDFRSDVYSLGIVIFEMFTGRVPFRGKTPSETLRQQIGETPPLESAGETALPRALVPVLRKALAKDPEKRHARARSLLEALRVARSATGFEDEAPEDRRRASEASAVPALLGALNPRDATVRLPPSSPRGGSARAIREAMAVLVAALSPGGASTAPPQSD
jgi:serine/threonine protein kinase